MTALTRLISSIPFRLTVAYMGAFVVAAALIVGFVAWRANALLTTRAVEALSAEIAALREQFQAGGPPRLIGAINERVSEPGSNLYLLLDATGRKVAGNLAMMPPELADATQGQVFTYVRTSGRRQGRPAPGGGRAGSRAAAGSRSSSAATSRTSGSSRSPWAAWRCGASACSRRSASAPAS